MACHIAVLSLRIYQACCPIPQLTLLTLQWRVFRRRR